MLLVVACIDLLLLMATRGSRMAITNSWVIHVYRHRDLFSLVSFCRGFKDAHTAELMMKRAKKLKYNAQRRQKLSKLGMDFSFIYTKIYTYYMYISTSTFSLLSSDNRLNILSHTITKYRTVFLICR